jgi:hypothetical protein
MTANMHKIEFFPGNVDDEALKRELTIFNFNFNAILGLAYNRAIGRSFTTVMSRSLLHLTKGFIGKWRSRGPAACLRTNDPWDH